MVGSGCRVLPPRVSREPCADNGGRVWVLTIAITKVCEDAAYVNVLVAVRVSQIKSRWWWW